MAVKKSKAEATPKPAESAAKPAEATTKPTKAAAKAAPAPAPAKASPTKAAPKVAADTAAKADTPKVAAKAPAPVKAMLKKAAPVKITDKQADFLKQIHSAGETGYKGDKKAEAKSLEALLGKKLIKKGAKDKASGAYHYTVSKAGEKHLSAPAASPAS